MIDAPSRAMPMVRWQWRAGISIPHIAVPMAYESLVASKKVRVLAVALETHLPLFDNRPTFKHNSVNFIISAFHGVYAPKGTPNAVKDKAAKALEVSMQNPQIKQRMENVSRGWRTSAPRCSIDAGRDAQAYLQKQDDAYCDTIDQLGLRVKKTN
jgi:tripartite-type tricarboxylate transporter receptor subunit TctC